MQPVSAAHWVNRVRLATGLVLFTYATTHFLNHSLGLISLDAMDAGRDWFGALWFNPVGLTFLYGSLAIHLALAFWSIYRRRSLRMPLWEAAQLLLGLLIPPLLAIHVIGSRGAYQLYGTDHNYIYELLILWVFSPTSGMQLALVLVILWTHGCIGLHFWLRLKSWYPRAVPYLYALALLIPVAALLGFVSGGQEVAQLAEDPDWLEGAVTVIGFPDDAGVAVLYAIQRWFLAAYFVCLLTVLIARLVRRRLISRRAVVITYPDGQKVEVQAGTTILDASRIAGIPHASVCGGRGRCSTCRVRISTGAEHLPAATDAERKVLDRVGAAPNVRLACQTRPTGPVSIVPLLPATASPRDAQARPGYLQGHEEEIAILFADLRAFTRIAEHKLPYDVVFLLNRYFRAMGLAVENTGGRLDKFIGDGVMALFGINANPAEGCRQALAAAKAMAENLREINLTLQHDLTEPLRIGIGIHAGAAIVGEMGHGHATSITAIGDAVNTASRLETLTKEYHCQLVVSETVARHAGLDTAGHERHEIEIRGRREALAIYAFRDAESLQLPSAAAGKTPRPHAVAAGA
ncbi:MAG TPA: adenylate/guanylate cyclase domain-containing protein [Dongiaceae bacterium]